MTATAPTTTSLSRVIPILSSMSMVMLNSIARVSLRVTSPMMMVSSGDTLSALSSVIVVTAMARPLSLPTSIRMVPLVVSIRSRSNLSSINLLLMKFISTSTTLRIPRISRVVSARITSAPRIIQSISSYRMSISISSMMTVRQCSPMAAQSTAAAS